MEAREPSRDGARLGSRHHRIAVAREPHRALPGGHESHGIGGHRINLAGRRELRKFGREVVDSIDVAAAASDVLRDARVLIVDDLVSYREHLADVISEHGAIFTAVAWDVPSLVSSFEDILPRVILLNVAMRDSAALLRRALVLGPNVRVIATGVADEDETVIIACAEAGVAGYHMRSDSLVDLLHVIERVADGEFVCSPQVSSILLRRLSTLATEQPTVPKELVLTTREAQILALLELGLSNRDIAAQLHIAVHTVKNHVHSLLGKLGVTSRAQAAALARSVRHAEVDQRN